MRTSSARIPLILAIVGLLLVGAYYLPPVHDRLAWRIDELRIVIKGMIAPPERVQFLPQAEVEAIVDATIQAVTQLTATPTATLTPTPTRVKGTPVVPSTATLTPTPLPASANLSGVRYEDQHGLWNYCAPANLSMALSYWGWTGTRLDTGKVLKPYSKDKNVMPYEMVDFVLQETNLGALSRVGGDLELIKLFVANGFPVLVEKGAYIRDFTGVTSWMGHYQVVTGFDDERQVVIAQDSYFTPDYEVAYTDFIKGWRSFNYAYVLIYTKDLEPRVRSLLGQQLDETANYRYAAQKASDEIYSAEGVDRFFAWFNRGSNLKELQDYAGAAAAYDEAFSLYNSLPEDKSVRPYRILWYQTGPYFAYFYTGRYYDVLNLATTAINAALDEPAIEESFYWRAMAKNALGDTPGAIEDFRQSLKYHPDFEPTLYQLDLLGVEP
ncbi:MAG: C39 family peptidase [Anaerolineales bacterium]|nr:C39 family peptidase [Anaerolineales bacterium]